MRWYENLVQRTRKHMVIWAVRCACFRFLTNTFCSLSAIKNLLAIVKANTQQPTLSFNDGRQNQGTWVRPLLCFRALVCSCQWYCWNGRLLFCMSVDGWVLEWSTAIDLACFDKLMCRTRAIGFYVNFYIRYHIGPSLFITIFKSSLFILSSTTNSLDLSVYLSLFLPLLVIWAVARWHIRSR